MATMCHVIDEVSCLIKELSKSLSIALEKTYTVKFNTQQANSAGEAVVISNELISALTTKLKASNDKDGNICETMNAMIRDVLGPLTLTYVDSITNTSNGCLLHVGLNRAAVISSVLNGRVICNRDDESRSVMFYSHHVDEGVVSMETARVLMVTQLLNQLHGNDNGGITEEDKLAQSAPLMMSSILSLTKSSSPPAVRDEFISKLLSWATGPTHPNLTVDCQPFISHHDISHFPRNIKTIIVQNGNGLTSVGKLAYHIYSHHYSDIREGREVVIVTSQRYTHQTYQAIILLLMACDQPSLSNCIHMLVVGPVLSRYHHVDDYVKDKIDYAVSSCQAKYGPIERGTELEHISLTMGGAAVKFELLSADARNTVRIMIIQYLMDLFQLKVGDGRRGGGAYEGCFVLYNYARMATLERNYLLKVNQKIYPPLSADVDYTVLTDKDEWSIIYNYIFIYPSIIKETCQLSNTNNTSVISSGCKKLSQFLIKLCHAFSRYYSRVKILMSPEPDLIPLIQARLVLVLTLKQVLADGLKLLQINPLNEL